MTSPHKARTAALMAAFLAAGVVAVYQVHSQEPIQTGYAVISAQEGGVPTAAALFSFRNGHTLVSEAAVEATAPIARGRIFVDQQGARTGLALGCGKCRPRTSESSGWPAAGATTSPATASLRRRPLCGLPPTLNWTLRATCSSPTLPTIGFGK